jgi:CO dehydrogenase maturation factor
LADSPNEYVVVDATAGVDTVATPLSVAYDLMVFVVEPTAKSTQVVLDYLATDRSCSERLVVVANKVSDQSDVTFIESRVGAQRVIGTIHQNRSLKLFEQGDPECFGEFVTANDSIWASIDHRLCAIERSWEGMHEALVTVHRRNCEWWYNSFYGESLDTGLDGAFPLI